VRERPPLIGCAFGAAIVAAPFFGLLLSPNAGLLIAAAGLFAVAWLCYSAPVPDDGGRRRLIGAAIANVGLGVVCLAVLAARLL
jgi:hypothetical protein